jgi:hypothetical protein
MTREILTQFTPGMMESALLGDKDVTRRLSERWAKVKPGDVLVARSRWRTLAEYDSIKPTLLPDDAPIMFAFEADETDTVLGKWRPAMFLPRRFCKLWMRFVVVSVRQERLGDLTSDEARREGIVLHRRMDIDLFAWRGEDTPGGRYFHDRVEAFLALWHDINGEPDLETLVWRIEFKRTHHIAVDNDGGWLAATITQMGG